MRTVIQIKEYKRSKKGESEKTVTVSAHERTRKTTTAERSRLSFGFLLKACGVAEKGKKYCCRLDKLIPEEVICFNPESSWCHNRCEISKQEQLRREKGENQKLNKH